jgi:hypothetical protein
LGTRSGQREKHQDLGNKKGKPCGSRVNQKDIFLGTPQDKLMNLEEDPE